MFWCAINIKNQNKQLQTDVTYARKCALRINHIYIDKCRIIFFYYYKSDSVYCTRSIKMKTSVLYIEDYKVLAMIGDGGQANVYLCSRDYQLYAIKVFTSNNHKNQAFVRQTKFLSMLKHQNLIRMFSAFTDAVIRHHDETKSIRSAIVLEFAQKGDLFEYISITKGFKAQFCRAIFKKLLNGLENLNQFGISHRDIKPENILFDRDFELKVSDFGLSTFSEGKDKDFLLTTKVGTEGFKAPEIDHGKYNGQKADIFGIGVILFVLYVGSPPFITTKPSDKIYKIIINKNYEKFWAIHQKNKPKGFFPSDFKCLMNSLLSSNPEERPTIQAIKQNCWLNLATASNLELKAQLKKRFEKIVEESQLKQKTQQILQKNSVNAIEKDANQLQTCLDPQNILSFQQEKPTQQKIPQLKQEQLKNQENETN